MHVWHVSSARGIADTVPDGHAGIDTGINHIEIFIAI